MSKQPLPNKYFANNWNTFTNIINDKLVANVLCRAESTLSDRSMPIWSTRSFWWFLLPWQASPNSRPSRRCIFCKKNWSDQTRRFEIFHWWRPMTSPRRWCPRWSPRLWSRAWARILTCFQEFSLSKCSHRTFHATQLLLACPKC